MLPLTTEQSRTPEQIQSHLRHLRNVLTAIQSEYESLSGCMLALGSDALHIIAPQDNLEDLAVEIPAIAYEAMTGLGLKLVVLICGQTLISTYEA